MKKQEKIMVDSLQEKMHKTTILTFFDDEKTREKFEIMDKLTLMADDERNSSDEFWAELDDALEWGKTYRLTIEEIP